MLILIAPAITGVFWGAPLIARELETGTGRLAWNQSITRTRWLAVKLALTGSAAMAVTEGQGGVERCLAGRGIRVAVSYQPASNYWPLQLVETGLFLALAAALAWFCFWRLDRRLA